MTTDYLLIYGVLLVFYLFRTKSEQKQFCAHVLVNRQKYPNNIISYDGLHIEIIVLFYRD